MERATERPPVSAAVLREALGERFPSIEVMDETGSTNADLLARAATAPDRSVLVAEFQNAGRGRLDRTWTSPPGAGLTFSVLLRPEVARSRWGWLPLLTGVAVREAVVGSGVSDVWLKWPNDVLIGTDELKVCGILAQAAGEDSGPGAVVIGVGLNVTTTREELGDLPGTSLALAGAADLDRTALLISILSSLDRLAADWSDCGGDAEASGLAAAYRAGCSTLGREITVSGTDGSETVGVATDIDADGHLLLDAGGSAGGTLLRVAAGDVRHARPLR